MEIAKLLIAALKEPEEDPGSTAAQINSLDVNGWIVKALLHAFKESKDTRFSPTQLI